MECRRGSGTVLKRSKMGFAMGRDAGSPSGGRSLMRRLAARTWNVAECGCSFTRIPCRGGASAQSASVQARARAIAFVHLDEPPDSGDCDTAIRALENYAEFSPPLASRRTLRFFSRAKSEWRRSDCDLVSDLGVDVLSSVFGHLAALSLSPARASSAGRGKAGGACALAARSACTAELAVRA